MIEVNLPVSKSIVNRRYIIEALEDKPLTVLSEEDDCADLADMRDCIKNLHKKGFCHVKESGTALRFLIALAACGVWGIGKDYCICCSGRLAQRPIAPLIDLLVKLGMPQPKVSIDDNGVLTIRLVSCTLKGGKIEIPTGVSTQFASALLLVSSRMKEPLEIELKGGDSPYIAMTRKVIKAKEDIMEADWSAASFFYEMLAIGSVSDKTISDGVLLKGLKSKAVSLQGDAECATLFSILGVVSEEVENGIIIKRAADRKLPDYVKLDMRANPDLVPPFAVACCILGVKFNISGVSALRHKESDRIAAIENVLKSLGYLIDTNDDCLEWKGYLCTPQKGKVEDFNDHRIAMAVEASGMRKTKNLKCVEKSFPRFIEEMEKLR